MQTTRGLVQSFLSIEIPCCSFIEDLSFLAWPLFPVDHIFGFTGERAFNIDYLVTHVALNSFTFVVYLQFKPSFEVFSSVWVYRLDYGLLGFWKALMNFPPNMLTLDHYVETSQSALCLIY